VSWDHLSDEKAARIMLGLRADKTLRNFRGKAAAIEAFF
jgi:hypothetical protein